MTYPPEDAADKPYGQTPGYPSTPGYQNQSYPSYPQPDPYQQPSAYPQPGTYPPAASYPETPQYGQPQYGQPGGFAQPGGYGQPSPFVTPGGYVQPGGYLVPAASTTNGMAIASLITGLVSLPLLMVCGFGGLSGIVAIVLGVVSINQIGSSPQGGKGLAIGGIVAGGIAIVLAILWWIVVGIAANTS